MRILVVHNQLWAHYKSKLFEEIHLNLSERFPDAVFKVAQIGLYESSRSNMQSSDSDKVFNYPYEVLFNKSLDQIGFSERLKALFKCFSNFRPDVLNITGYYDWAQILLMCYARLTGIKVVISSESSVYDHNRSGVKELVKKWIVNQANAFFCFGTTSVEYLRRLGVPMSSITVRNAAVIDDKKIERIYHQASENRERLPANFVYVGRLSKEKNLGLLLKAYQEVRRQAVNPWGLILVGDGPMRTELEEYVSTEKIGEVVFSGGVSWLEVPEWLAKSSVLILPSYSEPWGLVVNEALVCGLPVIVSEKCGCVKDLVISGESGYSFDPSDSASLVRHMLYFMNLPETELKSYGRQGQSIVSKFAAGKVAHEMVDTFVSLTTNKK